MVFHSSVLVSVVLHDPFRAANTAPAAMVNPTPALGLLVNRSRKCCLLRVCDMVISLLPVMSGWLPASWSCLHYITQLAN